MTYCQATAVLLAKRPLSEYKEIWEFFSDKYGRLCLVVPLSRRYRHLDYGQLLDVAWRPGAALPTVRTLELRQCFGVFSADTGIFILYLNELLRNLLPEHEPHPILFQHYTSALKTLIQPEKIEKNAPGVAFVTAVLPMAALPMAAAAEYQQQAAEAVFPSALQQDAEKAVRVASQQGSEALQKTAEFTLRRFELLLLSDLGFALPLEKTQDGQKIHYEKTYVWHIPEGASTEVFNGKVVSDKAAVVSRSVGGLELSGQVLAFLMAWRETATLPFPLSASQWQSLSTLLRATLAYYLAGKSLQTRKLWQLLHS